MIAIRPSMFCRLLDRCLLWADSAPTGDACLPAHLRHSRSRFATVALRRLRLSAPRRVGSSPRKPRLQRTRLPCAPRLWVLTYGKLVGPSRDRAGQVVGMPPDGVLPPKSGGNHSNTPTPSAIGAPSIAALPSRLGRALGRSDQAPGCAAIAAAGNDRPGNARRAFASPPRAS